MVAGETYVSDNDCGGYITVHSGTFDGPVVDHGNAPLSWTASVNGDHFVHYNTNSSCGTTTGCCTTTITCTSCGGGGGGCGDPYFLGECGSDNTCSGAFYDPQGSSSDYCNDESTVETYCSNSGNCIYVNFSSFDVESPDDDLNIYDGTSTSDHLIGSYDGTSLPNGGTIKSSSGCLTFEFNSDGTTTKPGWEASFSCGTCPTTCWDGIQNQGETLVDCGGPCPYLIGSCNNANTCSGDFYDTGGSGGDYSANENFVETYCSDNGNCIQVDFSSFETDYGDDTLVIYDGTSTSDPVIGKYHGTTGPTSSILSSNGCLTFKFNSDGSLEDPGWEASFSCNTCPTCSDGIWNGSENGVDCGGTCAPCGSCPPYTMGDCGGDNTCSGVFYDSGGGDSDYSADENSVETYCSDAGNCIQVDFESFETDLNDDTLVIYDGSSTTDPVIGKYHGTTGPSDTILSSNGCLTFKFNSDGSLEDPGWAASFSCATCPTCSDGIQNGSETGVDCGGTCPACPSCNDGIQNQGETGVDCGGPCIGCNVIQPSACSNNSYTLNAGETRGYIDDGGKGGDPCNDDVAGNFCNCDCITTTTICAASGEYLVAEFFEFAMYNTTSGFDWMVIYDGPNTSSPILFDNRETGPDNPLGDCNYTGQLSGSNKLCATNECLTFEFNQTGVVNRAGWEANVTSTPSQCVLLPIELLSFEGTCKDGESELTWSTASESNNSHFVLEKSKDGETFRPIDTVQGMGTKTTRSDYSVIDPNGGNEAYYRLSQYDLDGRSETFEIIHVPACNKEADDGIAISIIKNGTAKPSANITAGRRIPKASITLHDTRGKIVWEKDRELRKGRTSIPLRYEVPQGIYFLTVKSDTYLNTARVFIGGH